ncbi:hypothetical protein HPP92_007301 [Vanilla planifolia]|uniref:TFIIS central domain-containing protein n=1 Tax=Vanilla planifolia TaxID=51239 RepID=A0A835RHA2_VANPL|nr:hypothetical protein HPP92_007301 [Vanilla planifolia]
MIKCDDSLRDKLRNLLAEAFSRVSDEAREDNRKEVRNIVDEINACEPFLVAIIVWQPCLKSWASQMAHKIKYRSIMLNLKGAKNTDLRLRLHLGYIAPEKLINMTAEEMTSEVQQMANEQIQEKALFECERGSPKGTTDQFMYG